MKFYNFLTLGLMIQASVFAQNKEDIAAIKGQCGCFNVGFRYSETFSPNKDYAFHEKYQAKANEYVFVVEESDQKIVIQHLLTVQDTIVIKHWREDWVFENRDLFSFNKEREWRYSELTPKSVKNTWTQKVFQTDDSPRYEGVAEWFHGNGTHFWENKVDAPLPRREYSKRKDYNVLKRGNRIYVTDYGYTHEQDNQKILRTDDGSDSLIAEEKGYNEYRKIEASNCALTQKWWDENKDFWADVRAVWQEIFDQKKSFTLKPFVRTKMLGQYFDEIKKENLSSDENKEALRGILSKFVVYKDGI